MAYGRVLPYSDVLDWADAHRERTGEWPTTSSGDVYDAPGERWYNLDRALRVGCRGFPGGSSLARLLAKYRGKRNRKALPPFRIEDILRWADEFHVEHRTWPNHLSGPIAQASGETWGAVNQALIKGIRGLPGESSLARLLGEHRGRRSVKEPPRLTVKQILAWADHHHQITGRWPHYRSGPVLTVPGETWAAIDHALSRKSRGLRVQTTLANLLAKYGRQRNRRHAPPLTVEQILVWADRYHRRYGRYPSLESGSIPGTRGETWMSVECALRQGRRGLPGGETLARFLKTHRGKRNHLDLPRLTKTQIRSWARTYRQEHGRWPTATSGPVPGIEGQTWRGVDQALREGNRGLPGGSSLFRLLKSRSRSG